MKIMVRLTVPNYVYQFYWQASQHVADSTAERIMADALCAYAGLLSDDIFKKLEHSVPDYDANERKRESR